MGVLSIMLALGWSALRPRPTLEAPIPSDLDKLEPQLRAYLVEKVQWVRAAPLDARRQATLGMVYAANGLWAEARRAFQNVILLKPKEPLAHLYHAIATQELHDSEGALKEFRSVTQRFPNFAPGFYRLGATALQAGAIDEAEAAFRRLIALAPQEWRGYAGLGEVQVRQNNFTEAAKQLEHALQLDPAAKVAHHQLGLAYRGLGRIADAQRELALGLNAIIYPMPDEWSRTAPQHIKLLQDLFEMANEYADSGRPGKAVEILEPVYAFHTNNIGVINKLAIAYNRAGQPEKARPLLERGLQIDTRNLPALIALSFSLHALALTNEALAQAERAVILAPNTAQAHLAKANALLAMERDMDALAAFAEAFRCDPKNAEIQMEMGDVAWRNLERAEDALAHYQQASRLDPNLAPVQARLAGLNIFLGKTNEARASLEILRKLAPTLPELPALENQLRQLETNVP